jgi:IclR family acetate operon transcriptional repressor
VQTVLRTLGVLRALSENSRGLTLQELSDALGIPVSSLHRLLAVLHAERYVERESTGRRYSIGPAVRELTDSAPGAGSVLSSPHEALILAAQKSGETMFATELLGDRAICVALVEGQRPLRLFVNVGQEMPLHAAASARTVIAGLSDTELRRILAGIHMPAFTASTPTSVPEVMAHVAMVRERGYDICADELDYNVWAVAAPVRRADGQVFASVTLAAPVDRYRDPAARDSARQLVLDAAGQIAQDMGYGTEQ